MERKALCLPGWLTLDLAFNSTGDLFVATAGNGQGSAAIYEFTPAGAQSTFASGLLAPVGLAFQPVPEPSDLQLLAASTIAFSSAAAVCILTCLLTSHAADNASPGGFEYATIRWGGRDNTHVVRPGGEVEFVGNQLKNFKRPDRCDDRSFYMNIVMNGMAREGWELKQYVN